MTKIVLTDDNGVVVQVWHDAEFDKIVQQRGGDTNLRRAADHVGIGWVRIEGSRNFNSPTPPTIDPQIKINADARAHLKETDWYAIRKCETGVETPAEIVAARTAAREAIV